MGYLYYLAGHFMGALLVIGIIVACVVGKEIKRGKLLLLMLSFLLLVGCQRETEVVEEHENARNDILTDVIFL